MYCAVTVSFNTVSFCSPVILTLSLVQVTVVAGPPVEIQMRVCWSESNVTSPDIEMSPTNQIGQPHLIAQIFLRQRRANTVEPQWQIQVGSEGSAKPPFSESQLYVAA